MNLISIRSREHPPLLFHFNLVDIGNSPAERHFEAKLLQDFFALLTLLILDAEEGATTLVVRIPVSDICWKRQWCTKTDLQKARVRWLRHLNIELLVNEALWLHFLLPQILFLTVLAEVWHEALPVDEDADLEALLRRPSMLIYQLHF